jgi:hypothetical protein
MRTPNCSAAKPQVKRAPGRIRTCDTRFRSSIATLLRLLESSFMGSIRSSSIRFDPSPSGGVDVTNGCQPLPSCSCSRARRRLGIGRVRAQSARVVRIKASRRTAADTTLHTPCPVIEFCANRSAAQSLRMPGHTCRSTPSLELRSRSAQRGAYSRTARAHGSGVFVPIEPRIPPDLHGSQSVLVRGHRLCRSCVAGPAFAAVEHCAGRSPRLGGEALGAMDQRLLRPEATWAGA